MNLEQFRADPAAVHLVADNPDAMQRPMLPINRKGMPVPGPNFRALAEAIRGAENPLPLAGKGKSIALTDTCVELSYLVWKALYGPLQIPIKVKTEQVRAEFLPGGFYLAEGPQGPASADVMMISKHPGFDDVAQHANYSGKAAAPLFEALTELGAIDEAHDWYATHLVKHANLDPTSGSVPVAWLDDGRAVVEQEIALVQPRVIVCLGGEAIKELLGKEFNVTNMSQRVLTITRQVPGGFGDLATGENFVEHTIQVVALPNPASVAKRRETYPEFLEQLRFVLRTIRKEEAPRVDAGLDHQVIRTLPHLRRAIDRILREEPRPIVAWDAEWHGGHWDAEGAFLCTVQFTHRPRVGFLLDLCDTAGRWCFKGRREAVAAELNRLVHARGSRHGGHWFKADIPWIRKFLGVDLGPSYEAPHYAKSDGRRVITPWDRTKHEGGFDTGYMLHAVYEDATSGKLEDVAARFLGVPHYNLELEAWKSDYCNKNKIKKKELEGYGQIDRRVLFPYALWDVDVTRRLFDVFNGVGDKPGLIDKDLRGLNSRKPFWIAQQAGIVFAEMEATGVGTDEPRAIELTAVFKQTRDDLLESLRDQIGWAGFNIGSTDQLTELLFGEALHHKKDKNGNPKRLRPPEAVEPFYLTPVKSTGKPGKDWLKVVKKGEDNILRPATDKETLGILMHQTDDRLVKATLRKIRDIKFIGKVLTSALRPGATAPGDAPVDDDEGSEYVPGDLVAGDAGLTYDGGILYYRGPDNRVRSRFYPVETGRCSSSAPNMQNLSKRREDDYARINGFWEVDKKTGERVARGDYIIGAEDAVDGLWAEPRYTSPLRSIIREDDGHVMFEFDIKSAEVAILAWLAGDVAMMEDVRRNMLPEDDPDYIDIHSKTACQAFKLDCAPTKKGLKSIGKVGIRVAAKNVRFGVPYGRSAAAISRQCLEEGTIVSIEECEGLVLGYHQMYPQASRYLTLCESRPIAPGWMVSPFGRYRRFAATDDEKILASYGRSAKNFCIQSSVADWVMILMWKLVEYRRRHGGAPGKQFQMSLQVHDALVLRVPYASVEWVWNEVVPSCIRMIPIVPRTLDGVLLLGQGPYYFGVDMELFRHWSVKLKHDDLVALGIPAHRLKDAG